MDDKETEKSNKGDLFKVLHKQKTIWENRDKHKLCKQKNKNKIL